VTWNYTIDPTAETPIMLINKHIGFDESAGYGIMGDQFQRELLGLDALGKRVVQLWINSPGGSVHDGEMIFSAMQHSKCKVDTYNMGLAASIAAVLFQGGRKRVMMDYSKQMFHNPSGAPTDMLKTYKETLCTMICGRTGSDKDTVNKMMDRTTWLLAAESLATGFCDEVLYTSEANKGRLAKATNFHSESLLVMNSILNENTNKQKTPGKMSIRITNKLHLVEGTNEEKIIEAIEQIENSNKAKDAELVSVKNSLSAKDLEITNLKNSLAVLQKEKSDKEAEALAAKEISLKNESKTFVDGLVGAGKLKNDPAAIQNTMAMYFANPEGTKAIFENMPINKAGVDPEKTAEEKQKEGAKMAIPTNAAGKMAELKVKHNAKNI
jgi:ATP-dependent Clp endopeptidase proteolytic subunit ClpP